MNEAKTIIGIGEGDNFLDHAWCAKEEMTPEGVLHLLQQARNIARREGAVGTRGLDFLFSELYGPQGKESATFWMGDAQEAWIPNWKEVRLLICVFSIADIRIHTHEYQWNQNKPAHVVALVDFPLESA